MTRGIAGTEVWLACAGMRTEGWVLGLREEGAVPDFRGWERAGGELGLWTQGLENLWSFFAEALGVPLSVNV